MKILAHRCFEKILLQNFQTLHLFDAIHSNENKKYSYIFNIELVSKVKVKKKTQNSFVWHIYIHTRRDLNTLQCVFIAAQVSWIFIN